MSNEEFDFVIRGGSVVDGSGADAFTADVAVKDGIIAEVGRVTGGAREVYDADGLLVTPGFVDIHTHYDGQATWDAHLAPSSHHGVTTAVSGNCGVGFAPSTTSGHERLIDFMEGIEDIPGVTLHEGLAWDWETFPEFMDVLERTPHDIDLGVYVPHNAVRLFVMEERARYDVVATPEENAAMAELVGDSVRQGAIGFSTSRTVNHRSLAGEYVPNLGAATEELITISAAVGRTGRGVLQMVADFADPDAEFDILREMALVSGRPVSFTLLQNSENPGACLRVMERLTEAAAEGLPMAGQVPVRGVGMVMGLGTSFNPLIRNPEYKPIAERTVAEKLAIMRAPGYLERLIEAHEALQRSNAPTGRLLHSYDRMFELADPPDYEPGPEASIGARAARAGMRPVELIFQILTEGAGDNLIYLNMTNEDPARLDIVHQMLDHPNTVPGLSDAGAHVGMIADGSFPTTLLSHWGRDRQGPRFSVPHLVHQHTARTATQVGLFDRGLVRPGLRADLNVIDFAALRPRRPYLVHDLPAGGRRFMQPADGYQHTFVAGTETYRSGKATGALPGRLVRSRPF